MTNHLTRKSFKTTLRDRAKHSAKLLNGGAPKKNGAGGKGTWGAPGSELNYVASNDPRDPNYEDPRDYVDAERTERIIAAFTKPTPKCHTSFAQSIADFDKFKDRVHTALHEYFNSRDAIEFKQQINEIAMPIYHVELPCIIIKMSLDEKNDDNRSSAFEIIRILEEDRIVTQSHAEHSLKKLYDRLDDLRIDTPHAEDYIKEFAKFALRHLSVRQSVVDDCEAAYNQLHDSKTMTIIKEKYQSIVNEMFQASGNFEQACDDAWYSIAALNSPHTHFEFIKRLVRTSFDRDNTCRELASLFLAHYTDDSLVQHFQVEKGFAVLLQQVEELYLDVKDILHLLSTFIYRAIIDDCLPPAFLVRVDLTATDLGAQILKHTKQLYDRNHSVEYAQTVWGFNTDILQSDDEIQNGK